MKSAEHKPILIHRLPNHKKEHLLKTEIKKIITKNIKDYHHIFIWENIESVKLEVLRVEDAQNISVEELTKLVESTYKGVTNE
jgi:hypothetical protein